MVAADAQSYLNRKSKRVTTPDVAEIENADAAT